jgi:hypothetical protein
MSASNGDKARFNSGRKRKIALRERSRPLRNKPTSPAPVRPSR